MSKIKSLTPAQEQQFQRRIEEWRAIGLSTEPLDFEKAKLLVPQLYQGCGHSPPKLIFHCQSPWQSSMEAAILDNLRADLNANPGINLWDNLGTNLNANLWDNLSASLDANLNANIRTNLNANIRTNLNASLGINLRNNLNVNLWTNLNANLNASLGTSLNANLNASLGTSLWDNLNANLNASLGTSLRDSLDASLSANLRADLNANLGTNLWDNLRTNLHVNLWTSLRDSQNKYKYHLCGNLAYWYLLAEFCAINLGCNGFDKALQHCQLLKTGGWILPTAGCCFLQDRPLEMHWEGIRLHNPTGPAVLYRDGWAIYMWHGRRVERSVVMDPVTVDRIEKEHNAETRRIFIERFGQARYLKESESKLIHSDDFGTLYRKDQRDDAPIYMVNVICPSTGREYMLGIDPSAYGGLAGTNARAAVASTWRREGGKLVFANPQEYQPLVET